MGDIDPVGGASALFDRACRLMSVRTATEIAVALNQDLEQHGIQEPWLTARAVNGLRRGDRSPSGDVLLAAWRVSGSKLHIEMPSEVPKRPVKCRVPGPRLRVISGGLVAFLLSLLTACILFVPHVAQFVTLGHVHSPVAGITAPHLRRRPAPAGTADPPSTAPTPTASRSVAPTPTLRPSPSVAPTAQPANSAGGCAASPACHPPAPTAQPSVAPLPAATVPPAPAPTPVPLDPPTPMPTPVPAPSPLPSAGVAVCVVPATCTSTSG